MNLMSFLQRGTKHAPVAPDPVTAAAEKTRAIWRNALLVDQLRAWSNIGSSEPGALNGLATLLTLAGFAWAYDNPGGDSPVVRIIRGGLSAARQCAIEGCVVTEEHARALSAAATHATDVVNAASVGAIVHAAKLMHETAERLPS